MGFLSRLKGKQSINREQVNSALTAVAGNYFVLQARGESKQRKEVMKWDVEPTKEQVVAWANEEGKNGKFVLLEKEGKTGRVVRQVWGNETMIVDNEGNEDIEFDNPSNRRGVRDDAPVGDLIVDEFTKRIDGVTEMMDGLERAFELVDRLRNGKPKQGGEQTLVSKDDSVLSKALADMKDGETLDSYLERKSREKKIEREIWARENGYVLGKDMQMGGMGNIPMNMVDGKISANWLGLDYGFNKLVDLLERANVIRQRGVPPALGEKKRLIKVD